MGTTALREFVVAWWEARSLQLLEGKGDGLPVVLNHFKFSHLTDDIELLPSHGCDIAPCHHELGCDLTRPINDVPMPRSRRVPTVYTRISASTRCGARS